MRWFKHLLGLEQTPVPQSLTVGAKKRQPTLAQIGHAVRRNHRVLFAGLFTATALAAAPEPRVVVIRDWSLTIAGDVEEKIEIGADYSITRFDFPAVQSHLRVYEGPRPERFARGQTDVAQREDRIGGQAVVWSIWKNVSGGRQDVRAETFLVCGVGRIPPLDFEYEDKFHIWASAPDEKSLTALQDMVRTLKKVSGTSLVAQAPRRHVQLPASLAVPEPMRVTGPTHMVAPEKSNVPAVPLEVSIDISRVQDAAPYIAQWAEHAARVCKVWYPVICAQLGGDGFKPRETLRLVFLPHQIFPAAFHDESNAIYISTDDLCRDPSNYGMVVHELVHAVQRYPASGEGGWLVEGIADYIRYYLYEVDPEHAWIDPEHPERSKYTDSYRVTACFLDYLVRNYDPHIVGTLNRLLRKGGLTENQIKNTVATDPMVRADQRRSIEVLFEAFLNDWKERMAEAKVGASEKPKI